VSSLGFRVDATVVVVCVHDREKRKILTLQMDVDPLGHEPRVCECCENIYVHVFADEQRTLCETCRERPVWKGAT